jgi:hypothetical protein
MSGIIWAQEFPNLELFSSSLLDSTGAGAQLSISHIDGAFNNGVGTFPDAYILTLSNSTFTISGLAPNSAFTLFLYAFNNVALQFREEVFTVGNSSFDSANGTASSLDEFMPAMAVTRRRHRCDQWNGHYHGNLGYRFDQ